MSTDLYGIRILATDRAARRVRMRVFVVYYDVAYTSHQPVPTDRSFFVRVLCDKEALGDDISEDDRFDEAFIDANAFLYVDRFVELERRNEPVTDWSSFSDFYYERGGGWVDEDQLVQADYDVFVTKPEYVDAMVVGDSWGTTSYETSSDDLTMADHPHIPDFADVRRFVPFPGTEQEASAARRLAFSPDGRLLLVSSDAGGFAVFDVASLERVLYVPDASDWTFDPGWTADGRVAGRVGDAWFTWSLPDGTPAPLAAFGVAPSRDGSRWLSWPHDDDVRVVDADGTVLWSRGDGAVDLVLYAGWSADGAHCALGVETETLQLLDLAAGTARDLGVGRFMGVSLSDDGAYALVASFDGALVVRTADAAVIRAWKPPQGYVTGVDWRGDLAATTVTDAQGYRSAVLLHRTGAAIAAADAQPTAVPRSAGGDLRDVVALYLEQTAGFSSGWASHLDDDKLDMHLALARLGADLDLVPFMSEPSMQIAARAYEAGIRHGRGDAEGARAALDDALARSKATKPKSWAMTFAHAPIAAAQHVLGDARGAKASLKRARVKLDDESNEFQKRAVLCRALLAMGRLDDVEEIVSGAEPGWVSDFHLRLVTDLVDGGHWDLLRTTWDAWDCGSEWDAEELLAQRLQEVGEAARAEEFDVTIDEDNEEDALPEKPPRKAEERVRWMARKERWDDAYAVIDGIKKTKRSPLWHAVIEVSRAQGNVGVLLDALARLPCGDMNAPGLRALQETVKELAGAAYRPYHP